MPETIVDLDEEEDRIVRLVNADKNLGKKELAIKFIIKEYGKKVLKSIKI